METTSDRLGTENRHSRQRWHLLIQPGSNAHFARSSAYINNVPTRERFATTLYDMDIRNNSLYTQKREFGGVLTLRRSLWGDDQRLDCWARFDIYTVRGNVGCRRTAATRRTRCSSDPTRRRTCLLYPGKSDHRRDLQNGKLVGPVGSPSDFTGRFAEYSAPGAGADKFCDGGMMIAGGVRRASAVGAAVGG